MQARDPRFESRHRHFFRTVLPLRGHAGTHMHRVPCRITNPLRGSSWRSSRSSSSQRQLQSPCYDAMANIYRATPLPKIAVYIFHRQPSCVQLRGCQVSSPADNSTRSSTCSPVQDRRLRGCWSHPLYEARSAVQAVGSPGSTRVPQQPAKVNKLQLQHEEF